MLIYFLSKLRVNFSKSNDVYRLIPCVISLVLQGQTHQYRVQKVPHCNSQRQTPQPDARKDT